MGYAIAQLALHGGHTVYGFDLDATTRMRAEQNGIHTVSVATDLTQHTNIIWLMIPAGKPVELMINELKSSLKPGAIIIDGGNSFYKDSIHHAQTLAQDGIVFLDCGTSGGIHGIEHGFCLMVGGDTRAYEKILPFLTTIAAPQGVMHVGPSGAGHYVKMVHNGIEYGLLQAYAEGLHLLKDGAFKNQLDLLQITELWQHGAVIRSFLLELAGTIFKKDQNFDNVLGVIREGGTGSWTVDDAHKHAVPVPIIEKSVEVRRESATNPDNYAHKIVALLREQFGGHEVTYKAKETI